VAVAAIATAIAVVALSGCSSEKSATSSTGTSSKGSSATVVTPGGGNATKLIIDGKDQNVQGTTVCTKEFDNVTIAIGGPATGIVAALTGTDPPKVVTVDLGNVNGVTLDYAAGSGKDDAKVTKDGNTYKITGTATGVDPAHLGQLVSKPFEIDATCP
jgi:lipoprotein LpqH